MGTGKGKQIVGPVDVQQEVALASRGLQQTLGVDGVLIVAFHEGKIIGVRPMSVAAWTTAAGVSMETLCGHVAQNLMRIQLGASRPQVSQPAQSAQPAADATPVADDRGIKLAGD